MPISSTNRPPCRKKSILAEVCFNAKREVSVNALKCIFIYKDSHLHQFGGYLQQNGVQYGAKWSAIWYKMQCNMVLNAVRFGAKCRVKCC